ncbi:hypothetical protein NP493_156g05035 [Ridgeia piscesae]|uniref:Uncharacterized protein n=1 Tax=Ridgeia piscesae TaxID=27915 RepID=A0AAD9P4C6_RIDPI|nr:hypothetical protein NP493_156g05035 [Ridgeia piscesae]
MTPEGSTSRWLMDVGERFIVLQKSCTHIQVFCLLCPSKHS